MIRFGTSGWRGVIGRELTFRNVRTVTQAIIDVLRTRGEPVERIVIGYDTRMLSEKFARAAAELLASTGVAAELTERRVPSPVLASPAGRCVAAGGPGARGPVPVWPTCPL